MAGGQGRLVGVGFLVGAKDDGASETFDDVAESTDRLADSAERAGKDGSRNIGLLDRSLQGLMSINVANISDSLASLAERAGAGVGVQSTALESFGAQFNQTARAAEARLGSMSGAMRAHRGEVSSLAYGYGVSGDEMFAAMAPLSRMGIDIEDTGVSIRALAGHLQAGTVSGQAFGGVLAELIGTYDMEASAAGGLINNLTAIGDRFGFVAEIGQGLPAIMDAIRPVAARYPTIAADVDGVAGSIARLAAGMVNMGMAPEQALQAATTTFTSLSEQRDAFTDLVSGVSSSFPDMAQRIGISTGDIEGSMAAVMSSPVEFARSMGEALASMEDTDPMAQRLVGTLREISPELLNVIRNASEGGDALARAIEPIEGVEDAFNRVGQSALTSTLTMSDQLERMRDAFATRMNSIGRRTMPDFMSRQRNAYKNVGDTIKDFAGRDGPLGALTRGFLRVRTFGLVQGLLPSLGALGIDFGEAATQAGPMLHTMNQLGSMRSVSAVLGKVSGALKIVGGRALAVLGPIGLIAGAGFLIYQYWDEIPGLFNTIQEKLEGAASWFSDIGERFIGWVKDIDWAKAGRDAMDRLFNAISSTIESVFSGDSGNGQIGSTIWSGLVNIFTGIGTMLTGLWSGMWGRLTEGFTDEMGGGGGIVQRIFGVYFRGIQANVQNIISVFSSLGRMLIVPFQAWWRIMQPIGAMVMRIFSGGGDEAQGFSNTMSGVVGIMEGYQESLLRGVEDFERMADSVATFFEQTIGQHLDPMIDALSRDLPYIEEQFTKIWSEASVVFQDVFAAMGEVGAVVWELWTDTFEPIFDMLWSTVASVFGDTEDTSEKTFKHVGTNATNMWQRTIKPMLMTMIGDFAKVFHWIGVDGTEAFTDLAIQGESAMIRIQSGIERVRATWEGLQSIMRAGWTAVQTHTESIIGNMVDFVDLTFQRMLHGWENIIMRLKVFLATSMQGILNNIVTVLDEMPPLARSVIPGANALLAGLTAANIRINETVDNLQVRQREMGIEQQREERQLLRQMQERREEMEASRDAFAGARSEARSVQVQIDNRERQQLAQIESFYGGIRDTITSNVEEAFESMMDIQRRLQSGEIGEGRREGERVARLQGATSLYEQLPSRSELRLNTRQYEQLRQAIATRGTGTSEALAGRDIENALTRAGGFRGMGRGARGEALSALVEEISGGRGIRSAPSQPTSGPRGRGTRRTAATTAATTTTAEGTGSATRVVVVNPDAIGEATGRDIERRSGGRGVAGQGQVSQDL